MTKALSLIITMIIGTMILTNFVFATGEIVPTADPECAACSSGSPEIELYMKWFNEMLDIVDRVESIDPGAINGQGINFQRKKQQSNSWATYTSQRGVLSISKQARGVKSDMIALNNTHEHITAVASSLINKKSQRETAVDSSIISALQAKTLTQVGTSKLLNGAGNRSDINTHQDLMKSLASLHAQVVNLTQGTSGATISWQGYTSNKAMIGKIESYYACAQNIPACSAQTALLADNTASVRGYWADIVRAGQQVASVFSAQYWKTPKRNGKLFQFGDGVNQEVDNIKAGISNTKQTIGSWKEWAEDITNKRAQKEAQEAAQQKKAQTLQQNQQAIKTSTSSASAGQTQTTSLGSPDQAAYKQQDMTYLQTMLNASNDEALTNHLNMQEAIVAADATLIHYQIPKLTKQIYEAGEEATIAANKIYDACEAHCSNDPRKNCGKPLST